MLAEAIMRDLIADAGWESLLQCDSAGSRDYNVGDPPDPLLVAAAEQLDLRCDSVVLISRKWAQG